MDMDGNWLLSNHLLFCRGFSADDLPQRRAVQQDHPRGSPLQRVDSTRPSGRSIYSMFGHHHTSYLTIRILWWHCTKSNVLYTSAEKGVLRDTEQAAWQHSCQGGGKWVRALHQHGHRHITNSTTFDFHHLWPSELNPQHLFTCELDGREVRTVEDCVAKLKNLNAKGRLWPQDMIMEVQGAYLLLIDIETKVGLSLPEE